MYKCKELAIKRQRFYVLTDLSKWRTFIPILDNAAATTDSGKPFIGKESKIAIKTATIRL